MPSRRSAGATRVTPGSRLSSEPASAPLASTCTYIVSVAAQPGREVVGRVDGHDAAFVDDDDALTGLGDLGKDVRAQDDRVIAGEVLDQLPSFDDLLGVEAGGRLVEDQHVGVVDERLREADALRDSPSTASSTARFAMSAMRVRSITSSTRSRRPLDGTPLIFGDEIEILEDAHVGIERRRLGQVAGPALGLDRLVEDVEPGDDRFALRRRHVAR